MTDPQAMRALVAKWRWQASSFCQYKDPEQNENARAGFNLCADELDSLLAAIVTEKPETAVLLERVKVLEEVHNHWEFHSTGEDEFDEWMHQRIRDAVAALSVPQRAATPNLRAPEGVEQCPEIYHEPAPSTEINFCRREKGHDGPHWTDYAPKPFTWPQRAAEPPKEEVKHTRRIVNDVLAAKTIVQADEVVDDAFFALRRQVETLTKERDEEFLRAERAENRLVAAEMKAQARALLLEQREAELTRLRSERAAQQDAEPGCPECLPWELCATCKRKVAAESSSSLTEWQRMGDALKKYIEWVGGLHDDGCPEDDTCDCSGKPINDGINAAVRYFDAALAQPGVETRQEEKGQEKTNTRVDTPHLRNPTDSPTARDSRS